MQHALPDSLLTSLMVDGAWRGVGTVVVFLPQVLLLFLFIGILEDSGYLARAALIADRTMARVGLQGKSFIPLLSAYGCAVPAIMATRTIENKRDRIATILIAPFMTCSARLPVYALLIAAFIPDRNLLGSVITLQVAALLGLYLIGFLAAVVTARLLKSSVLKSAQAPFLLEMPSYRWPTFQSLGLRLLDRSKVFLQRAGTVILLVTVVLWVMAHLPYTGGKAPTIENSLAGTIGRTIEPVIKPLGFNWKIGIGLITSLAARETIIGTLGAIYGMDPDSQALGSAKGVAAGSHARRRGRAAHLLRLRHAVHVHRGGGAPRDRRMEVAHPAIRVHGRAGLRRRVHRIPRNWLKPSQPDDFGDDSNGDISSANHPGGASLPCSNLMIQLAASSRRRHRRALRAPSDHTGSRLFKRLRVRPYLQRRRPACRIRADLRRRSRQLASPKDQSARPCESRSERLT